MSRLDCVVIGAGLVGLATARELLLRHPQIRLTVIDKEPAVAAHQSGHNSGVIHSGLYYSPGSLKARLCVAAAEEMYRYALERGLPVERCGKVIVAVEREELVRLDRLEERARLNGVPGVRRIGPEELAEIEPHCRGLAALRVPSTGIVDFRAVAERYAQEVRERDGEVRLGVAVQAVERWPDGLVIETSQGAIETRTLIACAGLQADRIARLTGAPAEPRIVPFRGDYYLLRPERRHLVRHLIYPVPDPAFPFLGVHFTRRTDGSVWLGPNAVLAFAREGYRRTDLVLADLAEVVGYAGFRALARRHYRTGLLELWRDFSKRAFLNTLKRYIPELELADLLAGPSGVRAQALGPGGGLVEDFVVDQQDRRILHVRNAPSPAATSSLGIGRLIADRAAVLFD